ncbi:hypothetical protein BJY04DRAFT_221602 [Aspergillus karnatakaensis]|uniref:uncharacterized protein n=1 Tax=Aspergillus karnatakaensis TaxID=1810916 RepID=UPI003CCDEDC1
MSHSGEISSIINAVGTVASLAAAGDQAIDTAKNAASNGANEPDLFASFKTAGNYLETLAASASPKTPTSADANTRKYFLVGIWKSAAPLDKAQNPSPDMYHDIANILAENNIPQSFIGSKGLYTDVAQDIAQAIFADNPPPPPPPASDARLLTNAGQLPDYIVAPQFSVSNNDASCVISGAHAYYAIPLGKAATENIWHGALQLAVTTTKDFDQRHAQQNQQYRFRAQPVQTSENAWLVTRQISWNSVPMAQTVYPKLKDVLTSEYPTYNVLFDNLSSLVQTFKIQAPAGVTPAQVRCALTQAVLDTITQLQQGQQPLKGQDGSTPDVQLPIVEVTDSTLLVGGD